MFAAPTPLYRGLFVNGKLILHSCKVFFLNFPPCLGVLAVHMACYGEWNQSDSTKCYLHTCLLLALFVFSSSVILPNAWWKTACAQQERAKGPGALWFLLPPSWLAFLNREIQNLKLKGSPAASNGSYRGEGFPGGWLNGETSRMKDCSCH